MPIITPWAIALMGSLLLLFSLPIESGGRSNPPDIGTAVDEERILEILIWSLRHY
jgi:hypothetical protein